MLPFVKPAHVRRYFPEAEIDSYTDALSAAVGAMQVDTSRRNVLLTHQSLPALPPRTQRNCP